jgi:hypothetical protein
MRHHDSRIRSRVLVLDDIGNDDVKWVPKPAEQLSAAG